MGLDPSAVWDFAAELVGSVRGGSRRTTATVTRIDADGTTWVTTGDGGEAPATSVGAGVSVGDTVTLEWDGSAMGIRSNVSDPAPPGRAVMRATERAQGVASAAQKVADAVNQHFFADTSGIHVTEATQDEWDESHTGANVLINSIGQLFRDGLNNLLTLTTESGARALTVWDGLGNTASHIRAIIGEVITLGPVGSVQMVLSSAGLEIDNESGDEIFAIDSGSTGSATVTLEAVLVTWNATADVSTTPSPVSDANAVSGDTIVTATVNGTEYPLDSTYATAIVTAGVGVAVTLTSDGVDYVRALMVEEVEDEGSTVTTTHPCELSVEYQHAVTDIALLSLIGSQAIDGEGESLRITNDKWVANSRQSSTLMWLHNAITGRGIKLGVGSNGYTRGVFDSRKDDWIIARSKDDKTVINGTNFSVSSNGTVNASGTIASWYQVSARGNGSTSATRRVIALRSNSIGNRGLYDVSLGKWILYKRSDGTLALNDPLHNSTGVCTVNTTNAAIANNVNYCWNNSACCSIAIGINLKASMANNNLLEVATAPSGYRPPHTFYGSAYVTGQTVNLQTRIDEDGKIYVNNRSGTSVTTSANIYLSFTFAP